mmetsp:Transcript_87593/g.272101  ORF Transcript_87593/g.272101 Transcript_87593/m.272101 type:complete len:211 (-) Transcript_87593:100-732(-)
MHQRKATLQLQGRARRRSSTGLAIHVMHEHLSDGEDKGACGVCSKAMPHAVLPHGSTDGPEEVLPNAHVATHTGACFLWPCCLDVVETTQAHLALRIDAEAHLERGLRLLQPLQVEEGPAFAGVALHESWVALGARLRIGQRLLMLALRGPACGPVRVEGRLGWVEANGLVVILDGLIPFLLPEGLIAPAPETLRTGLLEGLMELEIWHG